MRKTYREAPEQRLLLQKEDISIVPLTSQLASLLKAEAAMALNGDGTCSLKAMSMSCFASEACARNQYSTMKLDMLLNSAFKFVALVKETSEFVGCVSAETLASDRMVHAYFPDVHFSPTSLILYNLCVSHEYRGYKVGRRLVQAVLDVAESERDVHLLVSRLNPDETDPEKAAVYRDRIQRLLTTYDKLGFQVVCDCKKCYLLKRT
jgi:GNAT superfamily N-acetyltransferase